VTCFVSSLEDWTESRRLLAAEFPRAVQNVVQPLRAHSHGLASCEIVARLRMAAAQPVQILSFAGRSRAALLIAAPKVVLSGGQIGFGFREEDARLAFQRLDKALEESGASLKSAAWVSLYALSGRIGKSAAQILDELWPGAGPAVVSVIPCEDLPALDASFAADALAVLH
jgi:enamine deaminase RidA (YjgF/YER057c/UK114 family)